MQRVADVETPAGDRLFVTIDGKTVVAAAGETVLSVLFAVGKTAIRPDEHGRPSGAFCGMGICYACCVTVDGILRQRACRTVVRQGMRIETASDIKALQRVG